MLLSKTSPTSDSVVDNCYSNSTILGYNEAVEQGQGCYTTAELMADQVTDQLIFNIGDNKMYGGYLNKQLQAGAVYKVYIAAKVDVKVGIQY